MKTLVFCTAYAGTQTIWTLRYRRWVEALRHSDLQFDQILLVDDGSSVLPDWQDLKIVSEPDVGKPEELACRDPLVFYHFEERLGRKRIYDFPGWYRSFSFAARCAQAQGFEKVIHIESDAFVISDRMIRYVNSLRDGWTVFWSPKYDFPEIAVQVVAGKQIGPFADFFRQDYNNFREVNHELMLPYTQVERSFVGDRYGESSAPVPRNADYANQVPSDRDPEYYWWLSQIPLAGLSESAISAGQLPNVVADPSGDGVLVIQFGKHGNSNEYTGSGWSHAELTSRWMVGSESKLILPSLPTAHPLKVSIWLAPCIRKPILSRQRLQIEFNGIPLYMGELGSADKIELDLPPETVQRDQQNFLRFLHPDAASPQVLAGSSDSRLLAFAVEELLIFRRHPRNERTNAGAMNAWCGSEIAVWGIPEEKSLMDREIVALAPTEPASSVREVSASVGEAVIPDLAGESYQIVLQRLHNLLRPKTYLEIGTNSGDSLAHSRSASIAVDPNFVLNQNVMPGKPLCFLFQMGSDEFFARFKPSDLLGAPIDLAFLDGMHLFEFLLRDFMKAELSCQANSVICLHDCIPSDAYITVRVADDSVRQHSPHPDWWTGDVWKVVPVLKKYRPDLHIYAVDAPPTGLILITNLDPGSNVLSERYFEIIKEFRDVDLVEYGIRRYVESLNLMPTTALAKPADLWRYFWL